MHEVTVLGVHPLEPTAAQLREAARVYAGEDDPPEQWAAALAQAGEELAGVVLIELVVANPQEYFSAGELEAKESGEIAWQLVRLSDDGTRVIDTAPHRFPDDDSVRLAFYLHAFDPADPLLFSYGELQLPPATPMPDRLAQLLPYEPLD